MRALQRLGVAAVAFAAVAVMAWLGLWQLGVYDDKQQSESLRLEHLSPVALDTVLGPDAGFPSNGVGHPVTVVGTYRSAHQLWVAGLASRSGDYAVTTPLVTPSGSAVLIVRGEASVVGGGADVPSGTVKVTGVLEPPSGVGGPPGVDGRTEGIRISALVNTFPMDLYDGYVVLTSSDPASQLSPVPAQPPSPSRFAGLRNLLYATQWWVFAAFVVFMAWRVIREAGTGRAAGNVR